MYNIHKVNPVTVIPIAVLLSWMLYKSLKRKKYYDHSKICLPSHIIGPKVRVNHKPTLIPGRFVYSNWNGFLSGSQGRLKPKMKLI